MSHNFEDNNCERKELKHLQYQICGDVDFVGLFVVDSSIFVMICFQVPHIIKDDISLWVLFVFGGLSFSWVLKKILILGFDEILWDFTWNMYDSFLLQFQVGHRRSIPVRNLPLSWLLLIPLCSILLAIEINVVCMDDVLRISHLCGPNWRIISYIILPCPWNWSNELKILLITVSWYDGRVIRPWFEQWVHLRRDR